MTTIMTMGMTGTAFASDSAAVNLKSNVKKGLKPYIRRQINMRRLLSMFMAVAFALSTEEAVKTIYPDAIIYEEIYE